MSYERISLIVNIIAIVLAPIVAVVIGQMLQSKKSKRDDKLYIFKTLMANRGIGWTKETVEAMNLIPVVFADDEIVTCQWKVFFDSTNTPDRSAKAFEKMTKEKVKLLEAMAKTLGYDKNITWETIGDSYMPEGMANQLIQNEQMRSATVLFMQQMQSNMEPKSESITR